MVDAEDWPYGFGFCCCGCGKPTKVVGGVQLRYADDRHNRATRGGAKGHMPARNPVSFGSRDKNETIQTLRNRSERMTTTEREEVFPHLNSPLVDNAGNFKPVEEVKAISNQSNVKHERLKFATAWTKANKGITNNASKERQQACTLVNTAYIYRRVRSDPIFHLISQVRVRLGAAVRSRTRKKTASSVEMLGCTWEKLFAYIESRFQKGMSWENYGSWHLDHIRPCASFDFSDPEQQKTCFHYTNLQPMWAEDNHAKNSRWQGKLIRQNRIE